MECDSLTSGWKAAASAVALAMAALLLACRGPGWETVEFILFGLVLIALSLEDLRTRTIPDRWIVAAVAIRGAYLLLCLAWEGQAPLMASFAGMAVLGVGSFLTSLAADRIFGRESLGGGDIKLLATVGFYFGIEGGLLVLMGACAIALIGAFLTRKTGDGTFPFGPSIAAASLLAMIAG